MLGGHRGWNQTYVQMARRFYWPGMAKDIRTYCAACEQCCMNKKNRRKAQGNLQPLQQPSRPGMSYSIEYLTDLPVSTEQEFDRALVVVDRFSTRTFILPTRKNAGAQHDYQLFYDEIVCKHGRGVPSEIVSDRDAIFSSKYWRGMQEKLGTTIRMSSARTQSTNGAAERSIAVIEEIMLMYLNYKMDNCLSITPQIMWAINNSPSDALSEGRTPLFVEMGFNPAMPMDLSDELRFQSDETRQDIKDRVQYLSDLRNAVSISIEESRERMRKTAGTKRRTIDARLKVNSKCWLSLDGINLEQFNLRPAPKLNPLYYGPFKILERPSANSFKLQLPDNCRIHDVFHASRLRAYTDPEMVGRKPMVMPPGAFEDREYEVQRISDHDFKFGNWFYRVEWKGYSPLYEATWEPRSSLAATAKKILKQYEEQHNIDGNADGQARKPRKRKASH